MATTDHTDTSALARDLRPAGIAGWVATALLFTGVITMSSGGAPEPPMDAPAADVQRYLETRPATPLAVGSYLLVLGLCALLWFVCGLSAALRQRGVRPGWLPTVVVVSGTVAVAALLLGATQAGGLHGADGLDIQVAQFAYDLGNITFANAWVALGSLGLASGWAILAERAEPGSHDWPDWPAWLGWWALAAGAGFLVARIMWTTWVWVIPYLPFWLWVLVVSTRMLRRPTVRLHPPSNQGETP
jgi:hypothetical protein